jgi:glycosyltransferase involved in cell wall biosynthesis
MQLSVVVPTLNGREELSRCLDALSEHAPDAEVVVVNGPSADGTTGMVRDRDDVDVLIELADRTINTARNAGINRASGDVIAFLDRTFAVEEGWFDALTRGLDAAPVVSGPTHRELTAGMTTESEERRTIAGREVTYFNPGNVAFRRSVLDEYDGFDEYLTVGGARDLAHRLAAGGYDVDWRSEMCARREYKADGGTPQKDWYCKYRSLSYRLVKNYGLRPTIVRRISSHAARDAVSGLREVLDGDAEASGWLGTGRNVLTGITRGALGGLGARRRDTPPRRNPDGRSMRTDRAVAVYE